MSAESYQNAMWMWRHLSVLASERGGEDEAHRIVRNLSDDDRLRLLELALTSQGLLLRDIPQAKSWSESGRDSWAEFILTDLLIWGRRADGPKAPALWIPHPCDPWDAWTEADERG